MLHPAAVEPLGLALHELATNAIKYGALGDPDRSLCVRWQLDEPGSTLTLEWIETGVSVLATAPRKRGFGFAFLEQALAYELNAQVDLKLAPGGLRCSIVMPVPAAMA
jgi:two-component system, chemotaxis family, CheB/CheR fusion protein